MSLDAETTLAAYHERGTLYRQQTAHHEAAHWLAGLVGGLPAASADVPVTAGAGVSIVQTLQGWGRADVSLEIDAEAAADLRWHSWLGLPLPRDDDRLVESNRRLEATVVMLLAGDYAAARAIRDGLAIGDDDTSAGAEVAPEVSGEPRAEPPPVAGNERDELGRDEMLAAVAAMARAAGQPAGMYDVDHARALLKRCSLTAAEAEARLLVLDMRAQQLVENEVFWCQVKALAAALLEHNVIDGATALAIVEAAIPARPAMPEGWAT